jgi:hypothetical protein
MSKFKFSISFVVSLAFFSILNAGVWYTSHADVDGDGIDEGIDYVIGENGEHNIPYEYLPYAHFIAWNTSRTCSGLGKLRQIIMNGDELLLDTGEPTLHNWDWFSYENTYYDSMTTRIEGEDVITRWVSVKAVLERIVNLNNLRAVNRYNLWIKNNNVITCLGHTAFINDWNDGYGTIDQAKNYVLNQNEVFKNAYLDSFPGLVLPDNYTFKIVYVFDDFAKKIDDYAVLAWDGYNGNGPDSPTIWGVVHLPEPCSLYCESAQPSYGHTYVVWRGQGSGSIVAGLTIKPEVINLKSHGVFTGFITLPEGYDPADIDISTVVCAGAHAVSGKVIPTMLIAKFRVQDIVGINPGPAVEFMVTGQLYDGTPFCGVDTVRVINQLDAIAVSVGPNPCAGPTVISFNDPSSPDLISDIGPAPLSKISILDETGRLIRTLIPETSHNSVVWDIRNNQGEKVSSGIYFIKIAVGDCTTTKKLIVLR